MDALSQLNTEYVENLYRKYLKDPASVEPGWQKFFEGYTFASRNGMDEAGKPKVALSALALIHAYRSRAHLLSTTNPIRPRKDRQPHLEWQKYGLEKDDLHTPIHKDWFDISFPGESVEELINHLENIYTGNIGFEYAHINDREARLWLQEKIENRPLEKDYGLSLEKKKQILKKLNGAVIFEKFLHTKYIGQKRFSLEGGENTIPALDAIINTATERGVEEVIIGMAHRGRLNVLANIMDKTYGQIFTEFEGTAVPDLSFGDGDVKYHLGFSSQIETVHGKKVDLKLAPNPSHLESVDPVVEGFTRAKGDLAYNGNRKRVLPILLHGDAAIAGQGVVYETAQMSQLMGYFTGGTIHFVINNQVGFTTDFDDARTTIYSTDIAKAIQAPVFHVNGDDAEAVIFVCELAAEYRQKFQTDVFVDMVCYRKHGHNEGDDPSFTQPKLYDLIKDHPNPRELYNKKLIERGEVEAELATEMEDDFWSMLQDRLDMVKEKPLPYHYQELEQAWRELKRTNDPADFISSPETGVTKEKFEQLIHKLVNLPENFEVLKKIHRLNNAKKKLLNKGYMDWAMGEWMAYATLLAEGHDVRISGQDVIRGTFSHRHSVYYNEKGETFERFNNLTEDQGKFMIFNSLLSEFAVLGFEYGYSMASPDSLVIWEAQFGDFYNGAQVIVDQYISAAESKWQRMSGLVMYLPHGYEGQGPEHSSARLERFLNSSAEYNWTVANVTKPANFFHLLRRQLHRPFRKPLVVMTPKSLLRHPDCISPVEEFQGDNRFQEIYDDEYVNSNPEIVERVVFCTGKIYYDLREKQRKDKRKDVALVRLEQLYPFPATQFEDILENYRKADLLWVQEEPINMGAWQYVLSHYPDLGLRCIARKASASTATGYKKVHDKHQKLIVRKAFSSDEEE